MGMYTADVAYNLVFYQRDAAFESFSAAKLVANELGFGDIYVDNLIARYEEEDFSIDSMLIQFEKGLARLNLGNTNTDRIRIILGFVAGNYIQKQYQIHSIIQSYKNKDITDDLRLLLAKEFVIVALHQQEALDVLLLEIEKNQYADDPGYFLEEFHKLRAIYENLIPLKDNIDDLTPQDIFQSLYFDELYLQIKTMRTSLASHIDKEFF
ncbi:hypothetical protein ES705_47174 [subsurface metagenome]